MSRLVRFWFQPEILSASDVDARFVEMLAECDILPEATDIDAAIRFLRRMRRLRQLFESEWEAVEIIERLRSETIRWQKRYYELEKAYQKLARDYEQLWQLWNRQRKYG